MKGLSSDVSLRRREVLAGGSAAWLACGAVAAATSAADQFDSVVTAFIRAFEIPGLAIAVVRRGTAPILRPYGVRVLGRREAVDIHTQFAIASNSKAFLAASFALMVDRRKLGWDDLVVRHLPEFRMYDPAVTQMMTVRDLLLHDSGLPLGAGDLMQVPAGDRSALDLLRALPLFKPARGFRAGYAYDNILYIVAGLLLERVSGQSWADFLTSQIFAPLQMVDAVADITKMTGPNVAGRHARLGPPTRGFGAVEAIRPQETAILGPAGGIGASVAAIVPWLQVQLDRGVLPSGDRLWSEAQADEMWRPGTIIASAPGPSPNHPERSVLSAYALGWGVADYRGRRMLSHAGGLAGQASRTTLLPEEGIGFVIYANSEDADAVSGLRFAILDQLLAAPAYDWLGRTQVTRAAQRAEAEKLIGDGDFKAPPGGPTLPSHSYIGRYRDPWYGDVIIVEREGRLGIDFTRTPAFKSLLEPFGKDCFRTRFPRGAGEDALVCFSVSGGAVRGVRLTALSPIADFSFDFQDLHLVRVPG